ncbi:unnamed protein product (macronuclear) [Paramecium tetraurelia]|uniref:Uncharacterized protein n=1 Tax=Paramecium tetraurelia TaxID=5888 RepID=A0E1M4_PARTE|nr:uncharacterized protein GSPATT00022361001 [Paramecium tetraurelia]CAK89191.1 unnamed protein product [Paramecium tetraurelia]|eukprot:XP_001456588.1 hypothetical protein (macronuclear) [Paramecium tetraurelia strain d4-2]
MGCIQQKAPSPEISIIILSPPLSNSPSNEFTLKPYHNDKYPAACLPTNTSDHSFHAKFIKHKGLTLSKNDQQRINYYQHCNSCPYF